MDVDNLKIISALATLVTVATYTKASGFDYTVCKWYNSRCVPSDITEFTASAEDSATSEWPTGPYALVTPSEGCPEESARGWERGYLSFTWKRPQTLNLITDCEVSNERDSARDFNTTRESIADNTTGCYIDKLPDIRRQLLGPFSNYAWRLNFCFKLENTSTDVSGRFWPPGSYSVFGDGRKCPEGLSHSKRTIKLPAVSTWTSHGNLPGFSVKTRETQNSVILVLNMCDHQAVENETNATFHQTGFPKATFILLKSKDDHACPHYQNTNPVAEAVELHTEVKGDTEITELFDICYYHHDTLPTGGYLYLPQNYLPTLRQPAFSVLNPTLIYGNNTSTRLSSFLNTDISRKLLPQDYQHKIAPWLLLDLGRNFIIVGLQFENYFLHECKSTEYVGSLDKTISGYKCQRWDQQIPHSHEMTGDESYPDETVSDAENYCRDPSDYGTLWCYTESPSKRWETCAEIVYNFKEDDRPFTQCFVSEERWRLEEFGGISCQYTGSYSDDTALLYLNFQSGREGRYVKLVGHGDMDNTKFYTTSKTIQVLTSGEVLNDVVKCNSDLGMGDESIYDHQISASSWEPQAPPSFARQFSSGWCAEASDTNPYITVDMMADTKVEGFTFFNWEITDTHVDDGIYRKKYLPIGSKTVLVKFGTKDSKTHTNKTYNFDMYLPIEQPQTFYHSPILARYVTVYIVESMSASSKCIRFELHGCKQNARPQLIAAEWTMEITSQSEEESITFNNLQILNETSVISSPMYPAHYPGGESYTWIVDFSEDRYIQLIFTDISFNIYEASASNQCKDKITLLPPYEEGGIYISEAFNGLVTLVETNYTYMTLTFIACRPMSQINRVGNGFNAIVKSKEIPTCFSARRNIENIFHNYCSQQTMFITSLSRLNFPVSNVPEHWTIHVKRFSVHLTILYFNVRCDSGSSLTITDRFSGSSTYCNLNKAPTEWYSDSDTVQIRFVERTNNGIASSRRISSRDGFKALYRTFQKQMTHLIDSHKTHFPAVLRLTELEKYWDPAWKNATLLMYQGCSKKFGKCYNIYSGAHTSWKQAGQECWIRQSRLVSIHSEVEQELIKYMLRNFRYIDVIRDTLETAFSSDKTDPNYFSHIGFSRVTRDKEIKLHIWEDGSPVTCSAWNTDEPTTNGDCTRMSFHLFNTNNTWETENCETGLASYFICEEHLTPEMLNISDGFLSTKYNGTLNITLNGIPCQRWDQQTPHYHGTMMDHQFPDLSVQDAENFCRDPSTAGYIWCYTLDPNIRYDKCYEEDSGDTLTRLYAGKLSRTSSGRTCQRWDSQTPHFHLFHNMLQFFPDASIKDAANHCRDPSYDGILWCYTTDPKERWETCNLEDTAEDRCHFTHTAYTGQWNITRSGIACQPWDSQIPQEHELFLDSQFPDGSVTDAHNYCRDPYNEGFLWCFTVDPALRSEPCVFDYKYQLPNFTSDHNYSIETALCGNGDAIPSNYWCDGIPNCSDLSDEANCINTVHSLMLHRTVSAESVDINVKYALFRCESKEWVSMLARCDRVIDCFDASDEINCSFSQEGIHKCSKDEYACDDGGCIHISQMCDFIADCMDGSDELCDYPLCSKREYRCRNQQCIHIDERCDAYENCLDGSDEDNCDVCKADTFHCDLVRCIPKRLVCDKYIDCKDETDEMSCDQPIYLSCEEWWKAGYRKSGIYQLNETVAECNFDNVDKDGTVYTNFHNIEVTARGHGSDQIHYDDKDFSGIIASHFQNNSYSCFQNITQSCVPAYEAMSDHLNQTTRNANSSCACIVLKIVPYRYGTVNSSLHYCGDEASVPNIDEMLFSYYEYSMQYLYFFDDFLSGMEISVGSAVCFNVDKLQTENKSVGGENNVITKQMRCVFETDSNGFTIGSRSGEHLQGCENADCPNNTVKCPGSFCSPLKFICDGEIQCPGGQDEEECGCQDDDREVLLLYEDNTSTLENRKIRRIATQFYTANSIVRELRYTTRVQPDKLKFDHRILDISDTVIRPYSTINREFACNYSILASDFVNKIGFSKENTTGILFFQYSNESNLLANLMFGNVKSTPEFLIYRIIQDPFGESSNVETFTAVKDVVVKSWTTLVGLGAKYFPEICTEAAAMFCPHEYKCSASKTCIPLEQVCDGQAQCSNGDDERSCDYSCPENCKCVEYTTDCSFADVDNTTLSYLHKNSRLLELSGNNALRDILLTRMLSFPYLISLNFSTCSIEEMVKSTFQSLVNLRILDLSFNNLRVIPTLAFIGLRKLKMLDLLGNRNIYEFEPLSLNGLSSLRIIEIRGANIHKLSSRTFAGLNLDELNMSDNNIYEVEDDVFSGMSAKIIDMETNRITVFNNGLFRGVSGIISLYTPAFKYCCVRPNYLADKDCFPEKDEFSSCADLLRVSALQTMLWLIGIVALFGNILSVIYRLIYDRERLKLGFGIFVTNLAIADFLMGIYLIIIAIADAAYRKRYIFMDDYWRNSAWCTLAGFLSTVSSEASVFFLCLITLDRLLVIKYPFGQVRFHTKNAGIASGIAWLISVTVSLIPILYKGYFQDRFYSKSGVCIALPLTRDRPPGWLYSIIIFIGLNFVTFCLIALGQVILYWEIKKAGSGIRRSSTIKGKRGTGRRRELAVARNLLLVVTTDFLCWFPIGLMGMMALSGHVIPGEVYAWTAVFILPVNSALNPVLYTLSAILGKKKTEKAQETTQSIRSYSCRSLRRGKKSRPFNGLFQYFITKADAIGHTFVSLDDIGNKEITLTSKDVLNIVQKVSRCLCLLHRNSLMVKIDGSVIYVSVVCGKVIGDVQIRTEPTECSINELKKENIYQLGQVVRLLLAQLKKAREHLARSLDEQNVGTKL